MAYKTEDLDERLKPQLEALSGGRSDLPNISLREAMIGQKFSRRTKELLRTKSAEEREGKRSDFMYELGHKLIEDGVDPEKAVIILRHHRLNKFKGRSDHIPQLWNCLNGATPDFEDELISDVAGSIKAKPVQWLMDGWIPIGNLSIVAGRQGNGKSQWTALLSAQTTKGQLALPSASVLYASFEDSVAETIIPRLKAVHAEMNRIHIIRGVNREDGYDSLRLPQDVDLLAKKASKEGVKLIVLDPLSAVLGDGKSYDSHREADVRRVLMPLVMAADKHRIAIVAVMHLRKEKDEKDPMKGVLGSTAFTAAARSVIILGYPDEGEHREGDRLLLHAKCNLGPEQLTRKLRIRGTHTSSGIPTSRIHDLGYTWEDSSHMSHSPQKSNKLLVAVTFLEDQLRGGNKVGYEIVEHALSMGISEMTLRRARKKLGVEVMRSHPGQPSIWALKN